MILVELIKAVIFGIVEGITEWLPISSTGHLILVEEFIKLNQTEAFKTMFNVVIQLGAILAVVVIYFDKLNPFKPGKTQRQIRVTWQLWLKVVIAILPVMILGLPLDDWFDAHFHNFVSVALMLIIYGFIFIYLEKRFKNVEPQITSLEAMSYKTAFQIGLFQLLSLMPGTSRSGSTIVGGLILGTSRSVVTEFTFFLGIPVMFGASALKILKFFLKGNTLGFEQVIVLLLAMVIAFVVSLYAIRFLTEYVKKHDFTAFGKYRIVLGSLILLYAILKIFI